MIRRPEYPSLIPGEILYMASSMKCMKFRGLMSRLKNPQACAARKNAIKY
jgi:hypothetical protein